MQESFNIDMCLFLVDESGPFQQSASHTQTDLQKTEEAEHLKEMEQDITVLKAQLKEQNKEIRNDQQEFQQKKEKQIAR